ncbi:hypothetical protein ANAEL_00826 [Anaerolineales bacterium]|nr:hypothetical protein ANAEL_00826 [Anaerolineales bacterium]
MSNESGFKMIDIPVELDNWSSNCSPDSLPSLPSIHLSPQGKSRPTSDYFSHRKAVLRHENGHRRRKGLSVLLQADTIHVIHQGDKRTTESDLPLPVENWPQEVSMYLLEG